MSRALFHDTITLYLPVGDDKTTVERRVITGVKTIKEMTTRQGHRAVVYLPLWGRRSLQYRPEAWDGRRDRFTVRIGDYIVCEEASSEIPPPNALTIKTVICRKCGSRRLWHLEIHADQETDMQQDANTNETDTEESTNEKTEP